MSYFLKTSSQARAGASALPGRQSCIRLYGTELGKSIVVVSEKEAQKVWEWRSW